jgi:hypothetical protein
MVLITDEHRLVYTAKGDLLVVAASDTIISNSLTATLFPDFRP